MTILPMVVVILSGALFFLYLKSIAAAAGSSSLSFGQRRRQQRRQQSRQRQQRRPLLGVPAHCMKVVPGFIHRSFHSRDSLRAKRFLLDADVRVIGAMAQHHALNHASNNNNNNNKNNNNVLLELEQKFVVSPSTVKRLKELGFEKVNERAMVDWYFDFCNHNYPLIRQDCWLRFRSRHVISDEQEVEQEEEQGDDRQWELKQGSGNNPKTRDNNDAAGMITTTTATATTTAYQEFVGEKALAVVQGWLPSLWKQNKSFSASAASLTSSNHTLVKVEQTNNKWKEAGLKIPHPTVDLPGLTPFARIVTHRSTWMQPLSSQQQQQQQQQHETFHGLTVDLDQTDFNYNVGEVEMVVPMASDDNDDNNNTDKDAKEMAARTKIQQLIQALHQGGTDANTTTTTAAPTYAKGKLEYYLQINKPSVYQILVETGLVAD